VKGSEEVQLGEKRIKIFTASWKHTLNERNMSIFGGAKTLRNNRRRLRVEEIWPLRKRERSYLNVFFCPKHHHFVSLPVEEISMPV
jgi:hypothetical protein